MIYLSAQPDEYYFLWQLQLQIYNFARLGIKPENIHILIGYSKIKGPSPFFEEFIAKQSAAQIYLYSDERKCRGYSSSIRPHIIAKHFNVNPWLEDQVIFYHDSDIIFNRIPNYDKLAEDKCWYASDTRSYLNAQYIYRTGGPGILKKMCDVIGITTKQVISSNKQAGGAQYLLKGISAVFWDKLETDSEKLFQLLENHNNNADYCIENRTKIQSWCADMWCIWWNALLFKFDFKIAAELGFVWANSSIAEERKNAIVHYTGVIEDNENLFVKTKYFNCNPFQENFAKVDVGTSSYTVVKEIEKYKKELMQSRPQCEDLTILLAVRVDSKEKLENIYLLTKYLNNGLKTNIILLEADKVQRIDSGLLSEEIDFVFVKDNDLNFDITKYHNLLAQLVTTKLIAFFNSDTITPIEQIISAIYELKENDLVYPSEGPLLAVDILMKTMFSKVLDAGIFQQNIEKHEPVGQMCFTGNVFLRKEKYIKAGMDNHYLTCTGLEDSEREMRMNEFGFKIRRIPGYSYYLNSEFRENLGRSNCEQSIIEYDKIIAMNKTDLRNHITD